LHGRHRVGRAEGEGVEGGRGRRVREGKGLAMGASQRKAR
jgi:hypothetical protein